jgi:predicted nucleic acid-binding protein
MIVVADTGPLISLAVIGQLDLLDALFDRTVIPRAVWRELEANMEELSIPAVRRFQNNVIAVKRYQDINSDLDTGEKEAIILYDEIRADQLLIEDKAARSFAEDRGVVCTGTLGILIEARAENLMPALRPLFAELLAKRRYFTIPLLNSILALSSEQPL